ncbi:MAG: helix-turn-helix transcriptional regulator [Lachnospiraceae bacterium]|nr:helix-turn-helix transcriptional regulator [Lachnospiraceae bacterium]
MPGQILSKRLQEILIDLNWTKEKLAEQSGLPVETIKNIYYGKTADPKVSTVLAIAEATGYSMNCLMGKCAHTPQEKAILRNYRSCGPHGKSLIELIAKYEAGAVKGEREAADKHLIPCLLPHGDIHKGIIYDTCETIEIETTVPEAYISVQLTSNALAPKYCKNDIILLENRFPSNGEYAVFFRNDRLFIRKFIEDNGFYRLKCLHNQGTDIILRRMDEVQYVGTCCSVVRQ